MAQAYTIPKSPKDVDGHNLTGLLGELGFDGFHSTSSASYSLLVYLAYSQQGDILKHISLLKLCLLQNIGRAENLKEKEDLCPSIYSTYSSYDWK
jgi:hypothetical protein